MADMWLMLDNISIYVSQGGCTALHCAIEKDRKSAIELLLRHLADVNAADKVTKDQRYLSLAPVSIWLLDVDVASMLVLRVM